MLDFQFYLKWGWPGIRSHAHCSVAFIHTCNRINIITVSTMRSLLTHLHLKYTCNTCMYILNRWELPVHMFTWYPGPIADHVSTGHVYKVPVGFRALKLSSVPVSVHCYLLLIDEIRRHFIFICRKAGILWIFHHVYTVYYKYLKCLPYSFVKFGWVSVLISHTSCI